MTFNTSKLQLMAGLLAVTGCALFLSATGCNSQTPTRMIDEKTAKVIAIAEAGKLGYDTNKLTLRAGRSGDIYNLYFAPPTNQLGGDLTVRIDRRDGRIVNVVQGQ